MYKRQVKISGGQQQRVAIARAIAGEASILLADEPTGSLDPRTGRDIFSLLRKVAAEDGRALVLVTHDLDLASELPRSFDCSELMRGGLDSERKEDAAL